MGKLERIINQVYQVTIYKDRWMLYVEGIGKTIMLASLSCIIGIAVGVLIALVKYYSAGKKAKLWRLADKLCNLYITLIRGTPMVVQLLIAYTVLFKGGFEACVFAFGINSGAYVAEVIRAGISSVDPGQTEAGRSLGLSQAATMRLIVMPQAIKNILPSLFNEFIALLKETSIAGYIAVRDLTKISDSLRGITFINAPLFIAAGIYLIMVVGMTSVQKKMERRLAQSDRD